MEPVEPKFARALSEMGFPPVELDAFTCGGLGVDNFRNQRFLHLVLLYRGQAVLTDDFTALHLRNVAI